MEEFLNKLRIPVDNLRRSSTGYVLDIEDSNAYGRIYSILDNSDLVDEDEESSQVSEDYSSIQFFSDDYLLQLIADFKNDEYRLTIKEN